MKTLVLSCIMLADSVLKQKTESKLLEGERLERDSVMSCFKEVCVVLQNASKQSTKTKAIRRKYLDESRMAVAKFRI